LIVVGAGEEGNSSEFDSNIVEEDGIIFIETTTSFSFPISFCALLSI
jgi:hypothetical protein